MTISMPSRSYLLVVLILIASDAFRSPAAAQDCTGRPAQPDEVTLAMRYGIPRDTGGSWGGGIAWNTPSPVALEAFVDMAGGHAWPIGLAVVYDLPFEMSGCAVAGVEYRRWPGDQAGDSVDDNHRLTVPLGLAAGMSFGADHGIRLITFMELGFSYNIQRDRNHWTERGRLGGNLVAGRFFGGIRFGLFNERSTLVTLGLSI
jgi:hypothetical protein